MQVSGLDRLHKFLSNVVTHFEKSAKEEAEDALTEVQRKMQEPGKPVTYPIKWDSDRQRRFVIAKLREEGNLPYKRKDAYRNGWKLAALPDGYQLSNSHPAGAIGGTLTAQQSKDALGGASLNSWQSKIHRGRWPALLTVTLQAVADMPRKIVEKMTIRTGND